MYVEQSIPKPFKAKVLCVAIAASLAGFIAAALLSLNSRMARLASTPAILD